MREYHFTLPFPPSSNNAFPIVPFRRKNGSLGVRKGMSNDYRDWLKSCPPITEKMKYQKCRIHYLIFFPDDRIRDGQSYLKAPLDYFVKQGFLNDDNRRIVNGECWEDGGIDRDNPRIEITILAFN